MKVNILLLLVFFMAVNISNKVYSQEKEIVAYFPEWRAEEENPYYIKNIVESGAAGKITVINYSFAEPGPDSTGKIIPQFRSRFLAYQQEYTAEMSVDGKADSPDQKLKGHFNQIKKLKEMYPNIRVVISIGGWAGSKYFSDAALTKESREYFVNSAVNIFIKGNIPGENGAGAAEGVFDGIDIDWEYPVEKGDTGIHHNEKDNDNLTELFALFRKKLDEIRPGMILSAAVPGAEEIAKNYNLTKDQEYLDYYTLMTYDFNGSWSNVTGHHTNLFSTAGSESSVDKTIKVFRDKYGVNSSKLVVGAAFYGRGWQNVEDAGTGGKNQAAVPMEENAGYGYFRNLKNAESDGFKLYWDTTAMAPYLYNPEKKLFWTFDDPQSMVLKAQYVDAYNLRGVMFWEITGDDSTGTLLNSIFTRRMPENRISAENAGDPVISIENPAEKSYGLSGSSILINTKIKSGFASEVEFFVDGKSIGTDTKAPFDWVWFNIQPGDHRVKAVAKNMKGEIADTDETTVKVLELSNLIKFWQTGEDYSAEEMVYFEGKIFACTKIIKNAGPADNPFLNKLSWQILN